MACRAALLYYLLALAASPLAAEELAWPVEGKLFGPDNKRSRDVSGIACVEPAGFPRRCLAIDDELQAAQFVTLEDGLLVAGALLPLVGDRFQGEPLSLDGEAVAYADGYFYLLGSHGHPRDRDGDLDPEEDAAEIAARIAASSLLLRVAAEGEDPAVDATDRLRTLLATDETLAPFLDRRLDDNGLSLEGIAIAGGRLHVGLRTPILAEGLAGILSADLDHFFGDAPPAASLLLLPLGEGQGLRDLAAYGEGLLLLAGPAGEEDGAYALHWWDGQQEQAPLLGLLPPVLDRHDKPLKAEAVLPLAVEGEGLVVLVLYDGGAEGAPHAWTVAAPP